MYLRNEFFFSFLCVWSWSPSPWWWWWWCCCILSCIICKTYWCLPTKFIEISFPGGGLAMDFWSALDIFTGFKSSVLHARKSTLFDAPWSPSNLSTIGKLTIFLSSLSCSIMSPPFVGWNLIPYSNDRSWILVIYPLALISHKLISASTKASSP